MDVTAAAGADSDAAAAAASEAAAGGALDGLRTSSPLCVMKDTSEAPFSFAKRSEANLVAAVRARVQVCVCRTPVRARVRGCTLHPCAREGRQEGAG